jgi:hypothetical protein
MEITQPFLIIAPFVSSPGDIAYFWQYTGGIVNTECVGDPNTILFNPRMWGGPLAAEASLYANYCVRSFLVSTQSAVATTFVGDMALAIESDTAPYSNETGDDATALSFDEARMVQPAVTTPYRLPLGGLLWVYQGDTIHFCQEQRPSAVGAADVRNSFQFMVKGFDSGLLTGPVESAVAYTMITVVIEFYNKIPPLAFTGGSSEERLALSAVRNHFLALRRMTIRRNFPSGITPAIARKGLLKGVTDGLAVGSLVVRPVVGLSVRPAAAAAVDEPAWSLV